MALKEYEVDINGITHTLQLSEEDAKRYEGATEVKGGRAPSNKGGRAPSNKQQSAPAAGDSGDSDTED